MRNDHYIFHVIGRPQPGIELAERWVEQRADPLPLHTIHAGGAEKHVMVPAGAHVLRPLVAEERYELAGLVVFTNDLGQVIPLGIIQPDVVFRVRYVIQTRILPRKAHEELCAANTLRHT